MNSEICPYTYEDIQSCKDISMDKVLKDYHNLCEFKADTNPRKFCGNNTLYYYQFRNLLNCKREKGKSLKEVFDDPELVQQLWKDTIKRNRRDKDPICSATDVYECHRINKGAIVFFKSSTAKYIYKLFNSKSVLDFTAGWGGRMLGASSLGINYIGIDTNINLKIGYENMIKDLQLKNCKMIWDSCLNVDYSKLDYDLILTSPPYINMELYEHCSLFNKDTFYTDFLIPTMDKVFLYLKEGGHMCINISPAMFKSLMKLGYRQPNKEIDLRQQLGQQYKTKSQDLIYVWSK
tara:strand:- start:51 stop:926 length:876 start_codon:yes stop_codon:yes gene_type:complete